MSGKHVAEDTQCDAICQGAIAEKWGYNLGSRCTHSKGHPTPRNGVGHYFPKGPWTAPSKGGYQAINAGTPPERRVPPKNPASSSKQQGGAA